jgi:hypothetical protein
MSNHEINLYSFWGCISDNPGSYFMVKVPKDANVDDIKEAIKKTGLATGHLILWKVSIAKKDLESRTELIQHPELIEGSVKLRDIRRPLPVFSEMPKRNHIHIIVQGGSRQMFIVIIITY